MLNIYPVILSYVDDVASLVPRIGHHDPDLATQLRRATTSVALNTAEGMYARGRSRSACYNMALREMRESFATLDVAVRLRAAPGDGWSAALRPWRTLRGVGIIG